MHESEICGRWPVEIRMCTWKIGGFSGHSHTPQSNAAESNAVKFLIDDFDGAMVPCYSCSLIKGKEGGRWKSAQ
jgi:hypothetical protein